MTEESMRKYVEDYYNSLDTEENGGRQIMIWASPAGIKMLNEAFRKEFEKQIKDLDNSNI